MAIFLRRFLQFLIGVDNGQIKIFNIIRIVKITEIETISGYYIEEKYCTQTIEIKPSDTQTIMVYNAPIGGLELIKVSVADKTQRIKGVTFEIRKMDGALVNTITTDEQGRAHLDPDAGDYYAVEIEAEQSFKIDGSHYFTTRQPP